MSTNYTRQRYGSRDNRGFIKILIFALILIGLYGWIGSVDYADARMEECAPRAWDKEKDVCVVEGEQR